MKLVSSLFSVMSVWFSTFLPKLLHFTPSCIPPPAGVRSGTRLTLWCLSAQALENCQTKHNWTIFLNGCIAKRWDSFVVKKSVTLFPSWKLENYYIDFSSKTYLYITIQDELIIHILPYSSFQTQIIPLMASWSKVPSW